LLREHPEPGFLCITEEELAGGHALNYDPHAFPDEVPVGGQPVEVSYAYAPGEEHDGVTIKLPFTIAQTISPGVLEWAVPGLREEKISELLRALPKSIRRDLMPFPPKVAEIVRDFRPTGPSFLHDLGRFIHQRFGVDVQAGSWPVDALPPHLRPRIEVTDVGAKKLSGRDLGELRRHLQQAKAEPAREPAEWQQAVAQWERFGLTGWTFGDLPERITVSEGAGLPLYAWPGLPFEEGGVNLRLFRGADLARTASVAGVRRLVELAIQKDLGWIERDLRALKQFEALHAPLGSLELLQETALEHVKRHVLPREPLPALTQAHFQAAVDEARRRLPGIAQQLMDRIGAVLQLRQQVAARIGAGAATQRAAEPQKSRTFTTFAQLTAAPAAPARAAHPLLAELNSIVPPRFLDRVDFERLPHVSRYLKALQIRAERAALNPVKDQERARLVAPYVEALKSLEGAGELSREKSGLVEEFRWMLSEFKVSVFAQELGTATPVSAKRLDQQLERIRLTA
jgi:ATP-dependent helicase HrpA